MTISLEFMDWIKLFMIVSAVVGNAIWIARTVKELKNHQEQIEEKLTNLQKDLKDDIMRLQEANNKKLEQIQEKHYQLREEVAVKFLKRDEWFMLHNKLEAKLEKKLDRLENLLREVKK